MPHSDSQDVLKTMATQCLSVRVRMINRMVTSIFDDALRPYGIKASQFNILVAVSTYGPVTSRQICRVLHMDSSTLSRAVARMRAAGWLDSRPSGEGKTLQIQATDQGLDLVRRAYGDWQQAQDRAGRQLGPAAVQALTDAGNRLLVAGLSG